MYVCVSTEDLRPLLLIQKCLHVNHMPFSAQKTDPDQIPPFGSTDKEELDEEGVEAIMLNCQKEVMIETRKEEIKGSSSS